MAERKTRSARWSRIQRVLKAGEVAEKGNIACIDPVDGSLVVASVSASRLPIGTFEDSFTGDGVRKMNVRLSAEIDVHLFSNATVGPVDDGDVGAICYLHSAFEVSMTSTGKSPAGRVWGVTGDGVWVHMTPTVAEFPVAGDEP